jgi:hypothetical protein
MTQGYGVEPVKIFKHILIGLLVVVSLPAAAEFTTITNAYEVRLSDFRAPASQNGMVAFKQCSGCELLTLSVTPDTRYVLNNKNVSLTEFRASLSTVRDRDRETLTVEHHLESDLVTAVSITL